MHFDAALVSRAYIVYMNFVCWYMLVGFVKSGILPIPARVAKRPPVGADRGVLSLFHGRGRAPTFAMLYS